MGVWELLGADLVLVVVAMSLAAVPSFRSRDASYVDGIWGLGFVLVALSAYVLTDGERSRKLLLLALTAAWGVRLSAYLFRRWQRQGPDARYQKMLGEQPSPIALWLRVFLLQAVVLFVVSLPVQLGMLEDGRLTVLNLLGVVVAVAGIATESLADRQLARFRADPGNRGKVMDRGLWGWSRHPNYFGEAVTWWGIALVAWHGAVTAFGLLGPLVITLFLLTRSGIGPLEAQLRRTKPQYAEYVARTSAFIPRRPKQEAKSLGNR